MDKVRSLPKNSISEAVARSCSVKRVFLKVSQNSHENTYDRVFFNKKRLALVFSCEFCENFKNTYFYRTPLVAVSGISMIQYSRNWLRISTYITALGHCCCFIFDNFEKYYTIKARRFNIMDFDKNVFRVINTLKKSNLDLFC